MAFNHNTTWAANAPSKSLREYGGDLLHALRMARNNPEEKSRPIIFIGHSFGGLIIKQKEALVIANEDSADDFCRYICQQTQGFIFLGTPHKGTPLTVIGKMISLFGHWRGSSTSLLEAIKPRSNLDLHEGFMRFLREGCGTAKTVCVFEAVKETFFGSPTMHVVEKDSAVIDGSEIIGFEKKHRDLQRFECREDKDYQRILGWIRKWVEELKGKALTCQMEMVKEKTREQQDCLKSLAFPEMNLRGNEIKDEASTTCAWLLRHPTYLAWLEQQRGLLWIKGKPGAGKSTLLKYALKYALWEGKQPAYPNKLIVASFFFHGRGAAIQKSPLGLFRSLLHQILDQIPDFLSEFSSIFKKRCETEGEPGKKWEWHVAELRKFLEDSIMRTPKAYSVRIYVDALDECGEEVAKDLVKYFQRLTSNLDSIEASLSICFSCRHYPIIALGRGLTVSVEDGNCQDIATYVRGELKRGFSDEGEAKELESVLVGKAEGIFQWVVLVVPTVLQLDSEGESIMAIRTTIQRIPSELDSLYQGILGKIKDKDPSQSLQLMQWICFAQRPLSLEELRFAMAVDADTPYNSLDKCRDSVSYIKTDYKMEQRVKSLSGGLAEVREHQNQLVAQFIHQSVNDYLIQSGLQQLSSSPTNSVIGRAHFRLSRSCIRYMTMEEVLHHNSKVEQDLEHGFPFLRYATTNWVSHAQIVEAEEISQGDLLSLFRWPSHQILQCWTQLYQTMDRWSNRRPQTNTSLLHIASRYGFLSVLAAVFNSNNVNVDVDSRDSYGQTPLSYAAESGHDAIVKLLLEKGAEPDSKSSDGQSPLSYAAWSGHEAVVKLLLEKGAEPDSKSSYGQSPLSYAAWSGHEAVVKLLLEKGAEPDSKSRDGRSPLSYAAWNGHNAVVKLLLEKGAEPDSKSSDGQSPLLYAAQNGHEAVVKLLLEKGAEPDSKSSDGQSPLLYAAGNGHEAVVKLLLEKGAEPDSKSSDGRSPLWYAAGNGHDAIVKLLLEKGAEPDSKSRDGRSPLWYAAWNGHNAIVKLLLEKGAEPDSKSSDGRSPLSYAAGNGHEAIVKLLLEKGAEPDSRDNDGRSPLSYTAANGHEAVVKLLLKKGAEPDSKSSDGQSPLWYAAGNGHEAIVKLLLEKGAEPDSRDSDGRSPLSYTAANGHNAIVKLLLEKGAEPDSRDSDGRSPLSYAARNGHEAIVKLLKPKTSNK